MVSQQKKMIIIGVTLPDDVTEEGYDINQVILSFKKDDSVFQEPVHSKVLLDNIESKTENFYCVDCHEWINFDKQTNEEGHHWNARHAIQGHKVIKVSVTKEFSE